MKKALLILGILATFAFAATLPAYAECHGGSCPMKHDGQSHGEEEEYQCPVVAKLMKKAHFFLENQKDLGLSDEQVTNIKAIKMDTKKAYIRQMAEMQIFELDMQAELSEPKVDAEKLNGMIDTMSANMATGGKASVAAFVKLKGVLSDDQMAKAKEIWAKSSH